MPAKKTLTLQDCINATIYFVACVLTGIVVIYGVVEMVQAACIAIKTYDQVPEGHDTLINGTLMGLECFFLAPMPLLLAFAIRDLIPAYKTTGTDSTNNAEDKLKKIDGAHVKLQKLKTTIVGLMATAMATNILQKSFAEKLDLKNILPDSIILILLIGYAVLLDFHSRRK